MKRSVSSLGSRRPCSIQTWGFWPGVPSNTPGQTPPPPGQMPPLLIHPVITLPPVNISAIVRGKTFRGIVVGSLNVVVEVLVPTS